MNQLPIFVNLRGRKVILLGQGEMADAKRRLYERAGAEITDDEQATAALAVVAIEGDAEAEAAVARLKQRGLLVNAVDRSALCDFTTPAIVDRDPVLIAIGTGGASAGLAKALRQRLEQLLPASLGVVAEALFSARERIKTIWPDGRDRRRAIDTALGPESPLDPFREFDEARMKQWLNNPDRQFEGGLVDMELASDEPDDLTLRQARLLAQADIIMADSDVPEAILNRARADAERLPWSEQDMEEMEAPMLRIKMKRQ